MTVCALIAAFNEAPHISAVVAGILMIIVVDAVYSVLTYVLHI